MYYENQTYYDILGLPKDGKREDGTEVTFDSIEKARNRLKFGGPDDVVPFSLWGKIDEAYDVLSNPEKRKEYDRELYEKEYMSSSDVENIEANFVSEETKEEPVSEETKEEPVSEETKEEPVSEETKEEPVSEETKEEPVSKETKEEPVSKESRENINVAPFKTVKIKDATFKGAALSTVLFGVPGTIVYFALKKGKYKMVKTKIPGKINAINSQDKDAIVLYNENVNDQVNKLLAEPHNNYKLEIIRVKLVNEVELYKKRLEIAKSFRKVEGYKIGHYFRISSLTTRLKTAQERLKSVEEKIKNYKWKSGLTKINEEIYKRTKEIKDSQDKDSIHVKNLQIRLKSLIEKRNKKGSKLKFGNHGEVLSGILSAKDFVVSVAKTPKYVTEGIQEALEERKRTR